MSDRESECWASAQRWHKRALKAEAEIERLRDEMGVLRGALTQAEAECEEQARLNGMGGERELRLRAAIRDAHALIKNDLVIPWIMAHKLDAILGVDVQKGADVALACVHCGAPAGFRHDWICKTRDAERSPVQSPPEKPRRDRSDPEGGIPGRQL